MTECCMGDFEKRCRAALLLACECGQTDGDHHKAWVIDQMVRCLTACPNEYRTAIDCHGKEYSYQSLGRSLEYEMFIFEACAGEDGPDTYMWDVGIAP